MSDLTERPLIPTADLPRLLLKRRTLLRLAAAARISELEADLADARYIVDWWLSWDTDETDPDSPFGLALSRYKAARAAINPTGGAG